LWTRPGREPGGKSPVNMGSLSEKTREKNLQKNARKGFTLPGPRSHHREHRRKEAAKKGAGWRAKEKKETKGEGRRGGPGEIENAKRKRSPLQGPRVSCFKNAEEKEEMEKKKLVYSRSLQIGRKREQKSE